MTIRKLTKAVLRRLSGKTHRMEAFSRAVRRWSNRETARFAPLFESPVVNVSAWADKDKEGRTYKEYFRAGSEYWITNYGTSQGGLQGRADEFFLDLQADLPQEHIGRFATVYNHTTLEHVWEFKKAFANLCAMSRDVVMIVVPWLQPLHSDYGDYWRFSPQAMVRLFEEQGMTVMHLDWNRAPRQSVYVFVIAVRDPAKWADKFPNPPVGSDDASFLTLPPDAAGHRAFD